MSRPMAMGLEVNGVETIKSRHLEKLSCDWEGRHMVRTRGERVPQQGALSVVCSRELERLPRKPKQMLNIMYFLGFVREMVLPKKNGF